MANRTGCDLHVSPGAAGFLMPLPRLTSRIIRALEYPLCPEQRYGRRDTGRCYTRFSFFRSSYIGQP